jgi:glucokinase
MDERNITVLAGDVGGTKTSLAVFSSEGGPNEPLAEGAFPSGDYPGLEELVSEFLSRSGIQPDLGCFGVAGPVVNGRARITNLPWVLDENRLAAALGLSSVRLLNDLLASASALPLLGPRDLETLSEGRPAPEGAIALVAPGTGLGEAFLVWDGKRYRAYPSEGGHADFAPANELEAGLLRHLRGRFGHVSAERVCSGSGIPDIYAYLREIGHAEEPEWLAERLAAAGDPVPVVVAAALDGRRPCPLCRATLDLFVSVLGAEAGNMALKVMATAGVYLGGGIPPRIVSLLQGGTFLEAFRRKGRMSGLMEAIPVRVILNPKAALLGAASHAMAEHADRTQQSGGADEQRT